MAKVREAWSFEIGNVKVSGDRRPAERVTVEVTMQGDGPQMDSREVTAETTMTADEWRELVVSVDARLGLGGSAQR